MGRPEPLRVHASDILSLVSVKRTGLNYLSRGTYVLSLLTSRKPLRDICPIDRTRPHGHVHSYQPPTKEKQIYQPPTQQKENAHETFERNLRSPLCQLPGPNKYQCSAENRALRGKAGCSQSRATLYGSHLALSGELRTPREYSTVWHRLGMISFMPVVSAKVATFARAGERPLCPQLCR